MPPFAEGVNLISTSTEVPQASIVQASVHGVFDRPVPDVTPRVADLDALAAGCRTPTNHRSHRRALKDVPLQGHVGDRTPPERAPHYSFRPLVTGTEEMSGAHPPCI